jgi:hypothetical protein
MGGTCGTYGVEERCIQGIGGKKPGKETWKAVNVDGRIILNWILKKVNGRAWTGSMWLKIGAAGRLL